MVPAANLLGFAGQELARKLPHLLGIFLETTLGSIVEIILFMVLIKNGGEHRIQVIQAAILGSILANLLLCLGLCFIAGGMRRHEQEFHEAVSEVGSNLMLVAGMGLIVPALFNASMVGTQPQGDETLRISRGAAVILLVAYCVYLFYQTQSHKTLYQDLLEADEEKNEDRHKDMVKAKLTLTESLIAVAFAVAIVSLMAVFLVGRIEYLVKERGVPDAYVPFRHVCSTLCINTNV
jgi:Ca2+:H+ antiporter